MPARGPTAPVVSWPSGFAPAPEQREVQAAPVDPARRPRVALELRGVPFALAVEKRRDVRAFVPARLVVHDPALARLILEQAIDHQAPDGAVREHGEPMLGDGVTVPTEQPPPAFVADGVPQRAYRALRREVQLGLAHTERGEFCADERPRGRDARLVPSNERVVGDALQPAVRDRPDAPSSLAHPRELDLVVSARLYRRRLPSRGARRSQ